MLTLTCVGTLNEDRPGRVKRSDRLTVRSPERVDQQAGRVTDTSSDGPWSVLLRNMADSADIRIEREKSVTEYSLGILSGYRQI